MPRFAALVLVAVLGLAATASADTASVGTWHLDTVAGTTTPDASSLANTGDDVAGTLTSGRFGQALLLASAGHGFRVGARENLLRATSVTALAWVRRSGTPGPFRTIIGKGALGCSDSAYAIYTGAGGGLQAYVTLDNAGARTSVSTPAIAAADVWDGQWHAVGMTFDELSRRVTLYVDGRAVSSAVGVSGTIDHFRYTAEKRLGVGRYPDSGCALPGFQYTGTLDEVRVYDRALRPHEVAWIQGSPGPTPRVLPAPAPPVFTDLRAAGPTTASGVLAGRTVTFEAAVTSAFSAETTGASTVFSSSAFDPPIPRGDAVTIDAEGGDSPAPGTSVTIRFSAPVTDPVLHLASLGLPLLLPDGTTATRVSGEAGFTVAGTTISGTGAGQSGTVRLTGSFTTIRLTAADGGFSDRFSLQVGTRAGGTSADLAARWPLDLVSGGATPDLSGNAADGRPVTGTPREPGGRFAGALEVDGAGQGVEVPLANQLTASGPSVLEPSGAFTVTAWARRVGAAPDADRVLVAKGGRCQEPSFALDTGATGGLGFHVQLQGFIATTTETVRADLAAPSTVWPADTWRAVAGVFDPASGLMTLWLDGRPVAASAVPLGGSVNWVGSHLTDRQLTIGRVPPGACGNARGFRGLLDEVRVYRRALTQRELLYLASGQGDNDLSADSSPIATAAPVLAGTPVPGQTLTCTQGTWAGVSTGVSYSTDWQVGPRGAGVTDPGWRPIAGATGSTYVVSADDTGSRVRCRVTRSDSGGSAEAVSRSIRIDAGPPVNENRPVVSGVPVSLRFPQDLDQPGLTCSAGTWANGPDLAYQWLRNGQPIPGATKATYRPQPSRDRGSAKATAAGDGGQDVGCRVAATNDVGSASAEAAPVRIFDDRPVNVRSPTITWAANTVRQGDFGSTAICQEGEWLDGGGQYAYTWLRNGAPIPGAAERRYTVAVEDLGRGLACRVTDTNILGTSEPATTNEWTLFLPASTRSARGYREGGNNGADPMNLLVVSDEYAEALDGLVVARLRAAMLKERDACDRTYKGPRGRFPDLGAIKDVLAVRCRLLIAHQPEIAVSSRGVRVNTGRCQPTGWGGTVPPCPNLGFVVPPIDPQNPPAADRELLERTSGKAPRLVIWDLDNDGRTDGVCPGSAPVLRTILDDGVWKPRAIIVDDDATRTGSFAGFQETFTIGKTSAKGELRDAQVRVCATSFVAPPNPKTAPCVTSGAIGKVQVRGNFCPVSVRDIPDADYRAIDGATKALLLTASENRLGGEGARTASVRRRGPIWVAVDDGARSRLRATGPQIPEAFDAGRGASPAAIALNVASALTSSAYDDGTGVKEFTKGALREQLQQASPLDRVNWQTISYTPEKASFALDQIYVARDGFSVSGMGVELLDDSLGLLIPGDAGEALSSIKQMTMNVRSGKAFLGPLKDEAAIPLSLAKEAITRDLNDARASGEDLLKEVNLDEVLKRVQAAKKALDLGPLKLAGDAKVKVNANGTATLEAYAELPSVTVGPAKASARADVKILADAQGRLKLQGLRFKLPNAYLGGARLADLDVSFDAGTLSLAGLIEIPPPASAGIDIDEFIINADGPQALKASYIAGPGGGIQAGPGVFITRLGGGFSRFTNILQGDVALSVGPSAGGGCPVAGIRSQFQVRMAEIFFMKANGEFQAACIPLFAAEFYADQTGYVSVRGGVDWNAGPFSIAGSLTAQFLLPSWNIDLDVRGTIRAVPVAGDVSAGLRGALSNRGFAVCGTTTVFGETIGAGGGVRFTNGRPPLTTLELLRNFDLFIGCDLGSYQTAIKRTVARAAQAGATTFQVPAGQRGVAVRFEGAGAAPRVILRGPDGTTYDLSDATGDGGKVVGNVAGSVLADSTRSVALIVRPKPGTWTVTTAEGSVPVTRVELARVLPRPQVRGSVSGRGERRVLRYQVTPIDGQTVQLVERTRFSRQVLKTVKRGGRGTVAFMAAESSSPKRTIVAEVVQDGLPRTTVTVARFTAATPRMAAPRVTVRRRGSSVVVSWKADRRAKAFEATVATAGGDRQLLVPRRGRRTVSLTGVPRSRAVRVTVVAFSAAGRRSKTGRATLRAVRSPARRR